jgi:hypothetical protein
MTTNKKEKGLNMRDFMENIFPRLGKKLFLNIFTRIPHILTKIWENNKKKGNKFFR